MRHHRIAPASGHVSCRRGKRTATWYAKIRIPDDTKPNGWHEIKRKLGPAWLERSKPPEGYLTKRVAESALREILVEADKGHLLPVAQKRVRFEDAANEWLRFIEFDRQRKASTLDDYRSNVNHHFIPAFGHLLLHEITPDRIDAWKSKQIGKVSNRSINKWLTQLHGVFERATKVYKLPTNPVAQVERLPERYTGDLQVYTVEEVHRLVAAVSGQDQALLLTAAFAGLRRGELIGLRWADVEFEKSAIRVRGNFTHGEFGTPKSGKIRSVPMVEAVADALRELRQRNRWTNRDDLVFTLDGTYMDDSALRRRFKAAQKSAGLRSLRFHDLRHTFGTLAAEELGSNWWILREWMGHADIKTTMRYVHVTSRAGDAAILSQAFSPKPRLAAA
jgi:integrase